MPDKGKGKIKKVIKKVVNTIRNEVIASRNTPIKVAKRTNNNINYSLKDELRVARENKKGRRKTANLTRRINKQNSKY
tara:strand:- start:496 stop:729 length:234 start_codon:yes stop_codon:yes gene_type:complete